MHRRELLILGVAVAALPIPGLAQQKTPVIGYINARSQEMGAREDAAFRAGLVEMGYVDGRNVVIDAHYLDGRYETAPAVARALAARGSAMIFASGGAPTVLAAMAATSAIPILFASGSDPVADGVVKSLGSPGGNVTGVALQLSALRAKMVALLHELVRSAMRIALLFNPSFGQAGQDFGSAALALNLHIEVAEATTPDEIDVVFARLGRQKPDALLVAPDPFLNSRAQQITALAVQLGVPAVYGVRDYAVAGDLMSYGSNFEDAYRQAGRYAGRILDGAKPADLPVVQSSTFQLVINLKTANKLGIGISPTLLARADEVIE